MWDPESLSKGVHPEPQPSSRTQIIASDSLDEKASTLEVSASLKASFLGGLVEVGGSAKYLSDTKKSQQQARVTLKYSATTHFKQLTMSQIGHGKILYPEVFEEGLATHVVTAVLYGAHGILVFDQESSSSESVQDIEGSLHVMVKKLPSLSIEGEGGIKLDDKEKATVEKFSCTFHGDFALESNPTTYMEAISTYAALPKLLGDHGEKAVPVKVWLLPLTQLDSKAAQVVREISSQLVFDIQDALEQLNEAEVRCHDLARSPTAQAFPDIKQKILAFRDLVQTHQQAFQKDLMKVLPAVRGGGVGEEQALVELLVSQEQSPFNAKRLSEFLDGEEREILFVNYYVSLLEGAELVPPKFGLEEAVLDHRFDFVASFTFTSLQQDKPQVSHLKTCLSTVKKLYAAEGSSSKGEDQPLTKPWYEDEEITQRCQDAAISFSAFARANQGRGKTRFIVTSAADDNNPGASIYLYKRGSLQRTSFDPPAKPLPPQIEVLSGDSVQLTFSPATFGKERIIGYEVEYRVVGQEDWGAVNTDGRGEKFTVTGLRGDTEHQFRYAAVCEPGCSERSDVGNARTKPSSSDPSESVAPPWIPHFPHGV